MAHPPTRRRLQRRSQNKKQGQRFRMQLEELEPRLAPAFFAVDANLTLSCVADRGAVGATGNEPHAVVFFESSVTDYQVLSQGLDTNTDTVVLDSHGDGLREMAAFLAGRHGLAAIDVVAHGSPGAVSLG